MTIEQTMEIPSNYAITIALPRSVPAGALARVSVTIPTVIESKSKTEPAVNTKSYRGILKGKGISIKRLRELQSEDKALEDTADERRNLNVR